MTALQTLHTIARMPVSHWRDRFPGRRPLGIYNAYVPEELFYAAGLTPVYLFHHPGDRGSARLHLPSFTCWPARSLVDRALASDLDGLEGLALAQTCDAVQALTDVWRKAVPGVPLYHVGVPLHLAAPAARPYLIAELNRLRRVLGDVSDAALAEALALYDRTRTLLSRLYDRAGDLQPTDLCAALHAALLMPKDDYNALLAQLLNVETPFVPACGPRLILAGPHLADPTVYELIELAGGRVAGDLLDVGQRYLAGSAAWRPDEVTESEGDHARDDPVAVLADRLLATLPTPTKYHPERRRDAALLALVTRTGADGVVFARQKFCDPHGFDYASAKVALERNAIPHLLLELEQTSGAGQMQTRVEAFLETLA